VTPDANQRALAAAVEEVLDRLDAHAGTAPNRAAAPATGDAGRGALDALCGAFGLSPFERDILVLTAAVEIDPTTAARCAAASGDPARPFPTFSLALAALREPHWSALTPVGALRHWRLVEVAEDAPLTTARLRIDERVLHFVTGVPYLDVRLRGIARAVEVPPDLPASHRRLATGLARRWTTGPAGEPPRAELTGADRQTRRDIAATAAAEGAGGDPAAGRPAA
jgi:hypothetical protein